MEGGKGGEGGGEGWREVKEGGSEREEVKTSHTAMVRLLTSMAPEMMVAALAGSVESPRTFCTDHTVRAGGEIGEASYHFRL